MTSLEWKNGKISEAKILSRIGGVLRVRSRVPLVYADGKKLTAATGENANPFFFTPPAPAQLVSPEAKPVASTPPQDFAYDISTKLGETITLSSQ